MYDESIHADIESVYLTSDGGSKIAQSIIDYNNRHNIKSMGILTILTPDQAEEEVSKFRDRIQNKIVIEIGAGVGFLALEMAKFADTVYAFETDPQWNWIFSRHLYKHKPKNLHWIFSNAENFVDKIHGDVCVIYTCSDIMGMYSLGKQMAEEVLMPMEQSKDVYEDRMNCLEKWKSHTVKSDRYQKWKEYRQKQKGK